MSREPGETHADYLRRRRREDPAYAERQRQLSLAAKRRRRGVCDVCGGETRYNGRTQPGPSTICARCFRERQHAERHWTPQRIVRAFQRFHEETGRSPATSDITGLSESQAILYSGRRLAEIEEVKRLGLVLPTAATVRREFGSWAAALDAAGLARPRMGGASHRRKGWNDASD